MCDYSWGIFTHCGSWAVIASTWSGQKSDSQLRILCKSRQRFFLATTSTPQREVADMLVTLLAGSAPLQHFDTNNLSWQYWCNCCLSWAVLPVSRKWEERACSTLGVQWCIGLPLRLVLLSCLNCLPGAKQTLLYSLMLLDVCLCAVNAFGCSGNLGSDVHTK